MNIQKEELIETIHSESAIRFLQRLININSINPPGNEWEIAKAIENYAKEAGLQVEIKALTSKRANIIVRMKGKNPTKAPLVLSGHLDTVPLGQNPWKIDLFSGQIIDGKLFGRGSSDMKGGVAALIEAMKILNNDSEKPDADIIFVGTAGEEVDCCGASEIIKSGILQSAGAMIVAEPSSGKVFSAHKGALWLRIIVYGKTAHGAMPDQGINAINHMYKVLEKLKKYEFSYTNEHPILGKPSLNVGTITGGIQTNVVPDRCIVSLDIRTIPEINHEDILKDMEEILVNLRDEIHGFDAELEVINDLPALGNKDGDPFIKLALDVNYGLYGVDQNEVGANYYTDASIYGPSLKIPIVIYGPGNEKMAHQPDEYIEIESYLKSINFYVDLARKY